MKKSWIVICIALFALTASAEIDPQLLKKAEAGDATAQYNMGVLYVTGDATGVPDWITGCAWIYISGKPEGSDSCNSKLSQNQMNRALHLVDDLKKNIKPPP